MIKRTSKSIGTISYNTPLFLTNQLDELITSEKIVFYAYIVHKGEGADKDHAHVFIEPNGSIDVANLRKTFDEPIKDGKPLGCMPFVPSDFNNWYLYSSHDYDYLTAKHEEKEVYDYQFTDFVTSNRDELKNRVDGIDRTKYQSDFSRVIYCIEHGMSMGQAIIYLRLPMQQIAHFPNVWNLAIRYAMKQNAAQR